MGIYPSCGNTDLDAYIPSLSAWVQCHALDPDSNLLLMQTLRGNTDGSGDGVPSTPMGNFGQVSDFWAQPGSASATAGFGEWVRGWMRPLGGRVSDFFKKHDILQTAISLYGVFFRVTFIPSCVASLLHSNENKDISQYSCVKRLGMNLPSLGSRYWTKSSLHPLGHLLRDWHYIILHVDTNESSIGHTVLWLSAVCHSLASTMSWKVPLLRIGCHSHAAILILFLQEVNQ